MNALDVSNVVKVDVTLSPLAIQYQNFGTGIILGDSDVIDTTERLRQYANIEGIAQDFLTTSPEYKAAQLHFSQSPKPAILYIGRWAATATKGRLKGATLSAAQQLLSNFTAVTSGGLKIAIDGGALTNVAAINFSAALNLNGVASILQTALVGAGLTGVTVVWDATYSRFLIRSGSTGTSSSVSFAQAPTSGVDISGTLGLTSAAGGSTVVGVAAETLLAAVTALADKSRDWYALHTATTATILESDHITIAQAIEAMGRARIYLITTQNPNVLDPTTSLDIASSLKTLNLKRTVVQFSSSSPYACVSLFARMSTVNFEANNSTITLKFKQEPGVAAEYLTETQGAALKAKNCNAFVAYLNGALIIQEGVTSAGYFIDEVHGTDWLQNALQTDVFNLLYQSPTKIPQTDDGTNMIVTVIKKTLARAVNNGLVASGLWNGPPIGQIKTGDPLPTGYYVFAPLVASQSQADREARKSVPIQVLAKLAGAIHSVNVLVTVNR